MARGGYRPGSGPKKGAKYRPREPKNGTKATKKAKKPKSDGISDDIKKAAAAENLTPLEYMLRVMNDPNEDKELRARMAVSAAPYMHPRKGEGLGKKDEQGERAKSAGHGKFAAGRPPISLVRK